MKYEHILISLMAFVVMQNFLLRRKHQQLWKATDKSKYINAYQAFIKTTPKQMEAIKQLRKEFKELTLLQAVEVSELAKRQKS